MTNISIIFREFCAPLIHFMGIISIFSFVEENSLILSQVKIRRFFSYAYFYTRNKYNVDYWNECIFIDYFVEFSWCFSIPFEPFLPFYILFASDNLKNSGFSYYLSQSQYHQIKYEQLIL